MSRIEVREEKTDRFWALRIDPTFNAEDKKRAFQARVTAFCDKDYSFEDHEYHWRLAEVSWYSIGSCSPEIAEAYSRAIELCSTRAREMNAEHGFSVTSGVTPAVDTTKGK